MSTDSLIKFLKIVKFYRVNDLLKAYQIDIPDYQWWVGCHAKKVVRLILLESSLYFNRKCRLIRLLNF